MSENFKTLIAFVLVIGLMCYGFKMYYDKGVEKAYSDGYFEGLNYEEKAFGHEKPQLQRINPNSISVIGTAARYQSGYMDGYNDGYKRALDDNGIEHEDGTYFEIAH